MRLRVFCIILLCTLLLALQVLPRRSTAHTQSNDARPDQVVLLPDQGPKLAAGTDYVSAPTKAAHPFTHMLIRREAHVPDKAGLTLFIRGSIDGKTWSNWLKLVENDDLWMPSDGPDVQWSQTVDVGATAEYWQVRGVFAVAPDGSMPALHRIEVNTVMAQVTAPVATKSVTTQGTSIPKPPVVSRVAWNCPDGEGTRAPPDYYPVNHMVVHHTADSNTLYPSEPNWGARVLAEWEFHTYTRGWGDIGYNYLIDPNGVVYEGRSGGDDAVGFHDTANYGSMGVALLGTYDTVTPTTETQNSLVNLLSWKAAQKGIDPLGQSFYYGCSISDYCAPYNPGSVVVNIAGHRDVTPGHTTCPGDAGYNMLPDIRNRVKQELSTGQTEAVDNGDLEIDEMESTFTRSNANWYDSGCGEFGHTFYTYATDNQAESTNSGTWRPNIPADGLYQVYVHVPQGCGLGSPPYATSQAHYTITYANGSTQQVVDQNTSTEWVSIGTYQFSKGSNGTVVLTDLTGEPLSAQRVVFFDAVKWVAADPTTSNTNVQITNVEYQRTSLGSDELLKIAFTVKNTGTTVVQSQAPNVSLMSNGQPSSINDGYVYDQDECFLGDANGTYPAYPKETDRFRVTLGMPGWDSTHSATCQGSTGDYPWRWGLNSDLGPGQQQTIFGYIRFRVPGTYNLQTGLVQENVKYYAQGLDTTSVTVTQEQVKPIVTVADTSLNTQAQVYQLGDIPENFLARTQNALSILQGDYVGSFAWDGSFIDWGTGGPAGMTDRFLVEQTRPFLAPVDGEYTFRTSSDDGSWLWVDGQPVVTNAGLHTTTDMTGAATLSAGVHVVSFKYFDDTGGASAGYSFRLPGSSNYVTLPNALGDGASSWDNTFTQTPNLVIAADDQGGSGVDHIHWSWDGQHWEDSPGAVLQSGKLDNGSYDLRYQAVDKVGNQSDLHELKFNVNTNLSLHRTYIPVVQR